MKIDVHAHFIPDDWNAARDAFHADAWSPLEFEDPCTAYALSNGRRTLRIPAAAWSAEQRLDDMDRMGIDVQVLSPIPTFFGYDFDAANARDVARHHNEFVAALVQRYPARFAGMAMVPLQDTDLAVAELRDARRRLGLRAVAIGTAVGAKELDDETLAPFFEACSELDMAVFIHPGGRQVGHERMGRYYLPNIVGNPLEIAFAASRVLLGGILERWPELRICFSHGGGALPAIIPRIQHAWTTRDDTRERTTVGPIETAKHFYFDTLTHDAAMLTYMMDHLGFTRIVMGSDHPFVYLGDPDPVGFIERAHLREQNTAGIFAANALSFLGMTAWNAA